MKFVSKVKSFILRNILRAAMLWIGEVEDAKSVDHFITSASTTGEPFQDFENLDVKIASGLSERKAQSEKRSLAGRQITWIIDDFFKKVATLKPISDFRNLSKAHFKNATKGRRIIISRH